MQTHPSSKPSAAWATDLIDKYRFNPFVRTTTHVVLLQMLLGLIKIAIFLWCAWYLQKNTIRIISDNITLAITAGATSTPADLAGSIEGLLVDTFVLLLVALIALNILFGILISRFALWPTRNSLQLQKRFIGNIAHEIRTPLAVIKTNTEVALFDESLPSHVRTTFTDTLGELDRISETINNLLSFDTLTRPRRIETETVDLSKILEAAFARHEALAASRDVTLVTEITGSTLVEGNAVALEQVATNLVKNAINYTPKDKRGTVTVRVQPSDSAGKVALVVRDMGIGIERKDLFHIFEPFYRGDTSRTRGVGTGTSGLGLAIVNEIVRLHKGAITIRSTVGQGTEITVTLPAAKLRAHEDDANREDSSTSEVSLNFS
jgi:signal transduction histidine kinase